MNLWEQLKQLYEENLDGFKNVKNNFPDDDIAGPLLMSPNKIYQNQSKKLLIIGQQTNWWEYNINDIDKQMKSYEGFNVGENYYASPFWNIIRKLELVLGNDKCSCTWTNLNKFDLDSGRPYGNYELEISKLDSILIKEIQILKPDICVFFTGPSFDGRLKSIFDNILFTKVDNWGINQLSKLTHPNLPKLSFRTHHPKSLRIRYLENDFIKFIKQQN